MLYADACYGGIPVSPITHGKHSYTPIGDIGTTLGRHWNDYCFSVMYFQ